MPRRRRKKRRGGAGRKNPNLPSGSPDLYLWRFGRVLVMLLLRHRAVAVCFAFGNEHAPTHRLGRFNFGSYQSGF